jgi:alpha-D-xyloside xylohydrolase
LYSAFAQYHFSGTPPFRALVLDYPNDKNVSRIDDEYMMGENILCAPFIDSAFSREVYFPKGGWYDFNNNKRYEGGKSYTINMSLDEIPMFVKANTILPLAAPVEFVTPSTVFNIHCRIYGEPVSSIQLFEDNSFNFDFEKGNYNWVKISNSNDKMIVERKGNFAGKMYEINEAADNQ